MNSSHINSYSSLVLKAPAKINWALHVMDKRDDGYHNILSLMHCIELYDTLTFEHSDAVELIADMDIPYHQNLAYKAIEKIKTYSGTGKGVKITLKKEIPIGAGLGGGSSDAASTLTGLNKLWGLGLNRNELKIIGSQLGSDVPFFFEYPIAIASGRGDVLMPLKIEIPYTLLLVKPSISISTKWAYETIDARNKGQRTGSRGYNRSSKSFAIGSVPHKELTKTGNKFNNIQLCYKGLSTGETSLLKSNVNNDFEEVITEKYPVIGILKQKLINAGARVAIMSGSGSTVFGLFEGTNEAVIAAKQFSSYWNKVVTTAVSGENRH